ncbi:N-acetylneuraminate synthase family protein [Antarcticibacterium sp. 1MA-6-2]|uniref:N-acetylneuraminate synthase family protein n=1 Tax=Antarcticibacterium sp. 1MA-6-2 TaxID=2908210 RepID=UPI0028830D7B|nr:N-acetylneuraminate synthase family protein [Antarcticibacterium sp. 1MA-6-2]
MPISGKPIILSSGMSSFEELDRTVEFLQKKNIKYSVLQCTTAYPTQSENYGLNVIQELKERYGVLGEVILIIPPESKPVLLPLPWEQRSLNFTRCSAGKCLDLMQVLL